MSASPPTVAAAGPLVKVVKDDRPNVVLIMADQWRGDALSCAGHPVVHTPIVDTLAESGMRFTRAYTATPTCVPARAGLYTGLSHRTHGRIGYRDGIPWCYPNTMASAFGQAGYQTQAIGKMHVYPERHHIGFDNVILHGALGIRRRGKQELGDPDMVEDYGVWLRRQLNDPDASFLEHGIQGNSILARPWDKPEQVHYTNFVSEHCMDFLRRRDPTRPFFLFMSFNAPHPPYDPPAWAFERYINMDMPDPPQGDWMEMLEPHRTDQRLDPAVASLRPDALQRARAGYYGHISHIDTQIWRFLEQLRWHQLYENTIFLFVSDHGEMLGDHDIFRKSCAYEGSAHVPLLVAGPRDLGIEAGKTCDAPVELMDVMPTMLDAAGVSIPETVEGRSLMPLARGEAASSIGWRSHIHGEHITFGQSQQYVTDGREKYIWWSGTGAEQYFDLTNDPQERFDLARSSEPAHQARVAHWRSALIAALDGREEGFTDGEQLIAGRPVQPCLSHLREAAGLD